MSDHCPVGNPWAVRVGACALAIAIATPVRAQEPTPPADHDAEWAAVDTPAVPTPKPEPAAKPGPPPPSPELAALHERGEQAEHVLIAGYVVAAVGGLVLVAGIPPLIAGEIEENKKDGLFSEAGDPEVARRRKRLGTIMMLSGLGVAVVGGALITVGLVRKKRVEREIQRLVAQPTASLAPWFGAGAGGLALSGRF